MIILGSIFAFINYIRGRGVISFLNHFSAAFLGGIATGIYAHFYGYSDSYAVALAIVADAGMMIWLVGLVPGWGGWGLYFASWTWVWNPNETEVKPIDWIGLKLVPFVKASEHWTNGLRGMICMSLRGLYILPLFYMLEAFRLGILIGLLQGIVYGAMHWLAPAGKGTQYAEPVFGALIGMAIAHTMQVGY